MLDVLDDFLWTLRREGFAISIPQAIDAARAAHEVGFADKARVREAIGCVVADSARLRKRYDELFDAFFVAPGAPPLELGRRLFDQGFSRSELASLRELLREFIAPEGSGRLRALLTGGAAVDHLMASERVQELIGRMNSPLQRGFYTHRALDEIGIKGEVGCHV